MLTKEWPSVPQTHPLSNSAAVNNPNPAVLQRRRRGLQFLVSRHLACGLRAEIDMSRLDVAALVYGVLCARRRRGKVKVVEGGSRSGIMVYAVIIVGK